MDSMRRLGDWLTGAQDPQVRRGLAKARGWKRVEWAAGGPEATPLDDDADDEWDQLDGDDIGYDPLGSLQSSRRPGGAKASIALEFSFMRCQVVLQLSKTSMPVYQNRGSQRTLMTTHTFVIVTATPMPDSNHELLVAEQLSDWSRSVSSSRSRGSSPAASGPVETSAAPTLLDNTLCTSPAPVLRGPMLGNDAPADASEVLESIGEFEPGRPLYFFRDGSIVHAPPSKFSTSDGKPLGVEDLLERANWAATPLGPREQWSSSLQSLVALVMSYPVPASIWWGHELTLIYNQRYADKMCSHPHAFAQSGSKSWAGESLSTHHTENCADTRQSFGRPWGRSARSC